MTRRQWNRKAYKSWWDMGASFRGNWSKNSARVVFNCFSLHYQLNSKSFSVQRETFWILLVGLALWWWVCSARSGGRWLAQPAADEVQGRAWQLCGRALCSRTGTVGTSCLMICASLGLPLNNHSDAFLIPVVTKFLIDAHQPYLKLRLLVNL